MTDNGISKPQTTINSLIEEHDEKIKKGVKTALEEAQVIADNKPKLAALEELIRSQNVKQCANTRHVLATGFLLPEYRKEADTMAQITGANDELLTPTEFARKYGYKRTDVITLMENGDLATYNRTKIKTDEAIEALTKATAKPRSFNLVRLTTK